jgi:mono/diheme cytochrome c family protein
MTGLRISLAVCAAFLVASFALGQKGESRDNPNPKKASVRPTYVELVAAPEKARAKRNPLERDPDAARAGGKLFARHCAECHGDNAQGSGKAPTLRAPEVQNAEPGALYWVLTNGVVRRGMPVWSKLPEPQRWQLVSYLKSLGASPDTTSAGTKTPGY